MKTGSKLDTSFYQRTDVVLAAKDLIGKVLHSHIDGQHTAGIITETEAYNGVVDRASHAYGGRRTKRTETMFQSGGCAYVYLCYGIHHLFNVVMNEVDIPHAILIRALHPIIGIETMRARRNQNRLAKLCGGPGTLSQAMGITTDLDCMDLQGQELYITEGIEINPGQILSGPRIGIDYAGEDSKLPYRFWTEEEKY